MHIPAIQRVNIVKADFESNYRNACGCNDSGLKSDLLLNEMADLINSKPMTIIQILSDSGYTFKGKTRMDLIKAVADQLYENEKFRISMGVLIALNNGIISYPEVLSYVDPNNIPAYHNSGGVDPVSGILGAVGDIVGGITGIFTEGTKLERAKVELDKQKVETQGQEVVAKEQTKQALLSTMSAKITSTGSGPSGTTILVALLGLAALGTAWYFLFFRNTTAAAETTSISALPEGSARAVASSSAAPAPAGMPAPSR